MVRPKATVNFAPLGFSSKISLIETGLITLLGSSIPTVFLPGIGACIRTSFAPKAKAISLLIPVILETLVPDFTSNSYCVTAGPIFAATTLPSIPKSIKTFSSSLITCLILS